MYRSSPRVSSQVCRGFTLIELVVAIVVLGILAAAALPRFVDLSSDAQTVATRGVAGSISSAASVNYVARKANPASGVSVSDCAHASALLAGGLPAGYNMGPVGFPLPITAESTAQCTVYGPNGTTAQAVLLGIL